MFYAAARAHSHTNTHTQAERSTHRYGWHPHTCAQPARSQRSAAQEQQRVGSSRTLEPQQVPGPAPEPGCTASLLLSSLFCMQLSHGIGFCCSRTALHLAPCNKLSYQVSLMYTRSAPGSRRVRGVQAVGARLNL